VRSRAFKTVATKILLANSFGRAPRPPATAFGDSRAERRDRGFLDSPAVSTKARSPLRGLAPIGFTFITEQKQADRERQNLAVVVREGGLRVSDRGFNPVYLGPGEGVGGAEGDVGARDGGLSVNIRA